MQKWLGVATVTSLTSSATGYYLYNKERAKLLKETVAELETEQQHSAAQCFKIEGEIRKLKEQEAEQQIALQDKMETVKSLWDERDRRFASETKRAADAIYSTPEAYTVMTGIAAHCNDSSNKFPYFYEEFDLNASKVHTIDMLANTVLGATTTTTTQQQQPTATNSSSNNKNRWLTDISAALGMFKSDPFVSAINLLLRADMKLHNINNNNNKNVSRPESVGELSKTFGRMMQHFQLVCCNSFQNQRQIEKATQMRQQVQLDQQKLRTINNNDEEEKDKSAKTSSSSSSSINNSMLPPPELGFLIERVVPKVADAAHLVTTAEADYLELQEQREIQRRKDIASSWQLMDEQDIFAAISYVTKTHDKVVTAAAKGEQWAVDARVGPAMKNLLVWSVAAEQYLSEMQTRQVLKNMTRCMSHSFVQINDLPAGYDGK